MTKLISLKIEEGELRKVDISAHGAGTSRNSYINKALRFFNHLPQRLLLAQELRRESKLVGQESLAGLRAFDLVRH